MAHSSPVRGQSALRASAILSSPTIPRLSEYLYETRNSPEIHKFKQLEAEASNSRVQEAAVHTLKLYELQVETLRIQQAAAREEEQKQHRLEQERKLQEAAVAERKRLEEIQKAEKQRSEEEARIAQLKAEAAARAAAPPPQPAPPPAPEQPTTNGFQTTPAPNATATPSPLTPAAANLPPTATPQATNVVPTQQAPAAQAAVQNAQPTTDRYIEVHQKLKELRKFMAAQCKADPKLKNRMGDMRREIRRSVGQISGGGLKENKIPLNFIRQNLRESLRSHSQPIDVSHFVLQPRDPVQGAALNDPQLPSLFLFLLNQFAKNVIKQYVDEVSADTKKAEPIGQIVAGIFSDPEFLWRGKSLIDIVQAKYRVLCPVLFGFRGDDTTVKGRVLNGWKGDGGGFVTWKVHHDRMVGLAAGYASMTLRDFSKNSKKNPWSPVAYWETMANIINSPAEQLCDTQCVILKALIEHFEGGFIKLYGSAAVAAMRAALVEFPARFKDKNVHVESLKVHPKLLALTTGLNLLAM